MIRWCKCGGRVCSNGTLQDCRTKERYALFKCDKCGKEYKQKKRGPDMAPPVDDDHLSEADYQTWMRL